MTVQARDTLAIGHNQFWIAGLEGYLPQPSDFGMAANGYSTGCYRGFFCTYVLDELLYLETLTEYSSIGPSDHPCVETCEQKSGINRYHFYRHKVCCDQVKRLVVVRHITNDGLRTVVPYPTDYNEVFELFFEKARLIRQIDHSASMPQLRKQVQAIRNNWDYDIESEEPSGVYNESLLCIWSFTEPLDQQPETWKRSKR